jgi:hypothetical protein
MLTPSMNEFARRCNKRSVAVFELEGQLRAAFLNYIELVGLDVLENLARAGCQVPFSPVRGGLQIPS